jgi:hypothetical protein
VAILGGMNVIENFGNVRLAPQDDPSSEGNEQLHSCRWSFPRLAEVATAAANFVFSYRIS